MHRIMAILIMTGVSVAAVGWWSDWDFSKLIEIDLKSGLGATSKTGIGLDIPEVVSNTRSTVRNVVDDAVVRQKDAALETVEGVRSGIVETFQDQKNKLITSLENNLGVKFSSLMDNDNSSAVGVLGLFMAVKADQIVGFILKNNDDKKTEFEIDWGDNEKSSGFLNPNEEKIVEHAWEAVGDYTISFLGERITIRVFK